MNNSFFFFHTNVSCFKHVCVQFLEHKSLFQKYIFSFLFFYFLFFNESELIPEVVILPFCVLCTKGLWGTWSKSLCYSFKIVFSFKNGAYGTGMKTQQLYCKLLHMQRGSVKSNAALIKIHKHITHLHLKFLQESDFSLRYEWMKYYVSLLLYSTYIFRDHNIARGCCCVPLQ